MYWDKETTIDNTRSQLEETPTAYNMVYLKLDVYYINVLNEILLNRINAPTQIYTKLELPKIGMVTFTGGGWETLFINITLLLYLR